MIAASTRGKEPAVNHAVVEPVNLIRDEVERRVGPQRFKVWFKNSTHFTMVDQHLRIGVPNQFIGGWIENHFADDLRAAADKVCGHPVTLHFNIDPKLFGKQPSAQLDIQAKNVHQVNKGGAEAGGNGFAHPKPQMAEKHGLRYQLSDFVVGPGNQLAHAAVLDVLHGNQRLYNPLYVYSPCGLGKTHLLQGLCQALAAEDKLRWAYVTGEEFTNDFIFSIKRHTPEAFRERYRQLDVLVIDDVQFLANKKATQDELLHTFDAIDARGKQIVMASDAQPKLLGQLSAGLVSRFMSGMVVKMDLPDGETRRAILRRKSASLSKPVPELVIAYVAELFKNNVRELEGALLKLYAYSCLAGQPISLPLARTALEEYAAKIKPVVQVADIEAGVSNYFGITPADLHSTNRTRTVALARNVAMYLARRQTKMSFPEIARHMGGKNHATVLLACRRIERMLETNEPGVWNTSAGVLVQRPIEEVLAAVSDDVPSSFIRQEQPIALAR